ncbi:MAG: SDR family NAD(P)-dependent oxidoreductase, partial [Pseudomonadales bacterium]|nr:SDR family NAD(P)-dependent oxidoreductase [Pseudomonadales bacterium]
DYLFNNAGIAFVGEVAETTLDQWQALVNINQMGLVYGTLKAYEVMRKQGHGHIVNTASVAGLMPAPMLTAYAMTKHAVAGLTLSLREEAACYGVKVSMVCPGIIRTNIVDGTDMNSLGGNSKDPYEHFEKNTAFKAISADEAATYILKGVKKNLPEIIFPLHGKIMVNLFHYARRAWELGISKGLKDMGLNQAR